MILYLGDTSELFASRVTAQHSQSRLCTNDNISTVIDTDVIYTSLDDVTHENFIKLCLIADSVVVDDRAPREVKDFYNLFFTDNKISDVASLLDSCRLVDFRKTGKPQMWAAGCSYTSAVGVEDHQRWADKLAEKLKKQVSILAAPRASIPWAADQLLRSDIRSGDQIFWMLTTTHRIDYFSEDNQAIKIWPEINKNELDRDEYSLMMKVLTHKWNVYLAVKTISQVINYCTKIGARLYIGQALRNDITTDRTLIKLLRQYPNFIVDFSMELQYNKFMLDIGTDKQHPGPNTHSKIAEVFYKYVF